MEVEIKDFVGVFKNAFTPEYCEAVIQTFENARALGMVRSRQQLEGVAKHVKDTDVFWFGADCEYSMMYSKHLAVFNDVLWNSAFSAYADKFDILKDMGPLGYYEAKVQRTDVGGGYHVWHQEVSSQTPKRVFLFMLYLNDVEEGGETELLYYPRRIKPEQGTLVILPAGFTHTHRGNPPLSGAKYMLNGWIEL